MLFADEAVPVVSNTAAALLSGAILLVPIIAAAVVKLFDARHKNKQEAEATAITQYREVADRLQKQIERQDSHIGELSGAIEEMGEEHVACREELVATYGVVLLLYDFSRRAAAALKRLGEDPGEVPPLPPKPSRPDRSAREFRARSLAQDTRSLHESSAVLPKPQPLPPPGEKP